MEYLTLLIQVFFPQITTISKLTEIVSKASNSQQLQKLLQ